ncbi:glycoside hydrolase family 43 protein [Niveibacterium sp. SC-1]|uniref:glycoside hydrolase family 43 protein n=1 Tax=Niveibacterium sp. SC-1 TaxID=3135646 RepID=UPI00311EA887
MSRNIHNPVLPGFHPDPSILRVGEDYYLATSTFEWWPGVRIHHSRDLVHWQHHSYVLTRESQLAMRGNPNSAGIWAPCLTHAHGQFWLIFTNVRSFTGAYKDTHNYLVTAPSLDGPWSEPVYLNSSGFDPSLFHDDDGRTWLANMEWSFCKGTNPFSGILLQEYDRDAQRLVGPIHRIFEGTSLGRVEGPHVYKREGYYYLMTAEGGTGYEHAVTVARSRSLTGPYELPTTVQHPLLTADGKSAGALQRAGHGCLVDTPAGEWYLAHLCGRPIEWAELPEDAPTPESYRGAHCILGRETALQRVEWTADGWLRTTHGDNVPRREVPAPDLPAAPFAAEPARDDFDAPALSGHFNSLRAPFDPSWVSLAARPGWLRLTGRESLMSFHDQSLVMRRQQHFRCEAETELDFAPESFQQMAGLLAYYNTQNHAYLCVTVAPHGAPNAGERVLRLLGNDHGIYHEWSEAIPLAAGTVRLKVVFALDRFHFEYAQGDAPWQPVGPALPAAMLSDEHATVFDGGYARSFGFTGNYLGLACQDLTGRRMHADFDHFTYRESV